MVKIFAALLGSLTDCCCRIKLSIVMERSIEFVNKNEFEKREKKNQGFSHWSLLAIFTLHFSKKNPSNGQISEFSHNTKLNIFP